MQRWLRILHEVCSLPTAPFLEAAVVHYVRRFVEARPQLRLRQDQAGNLLVELPGRRRRLPRWVLTAHMDHPGLVARRMAGPAILEADFRGHVLADHVPGAAVRFFAPEQSVPGRIRRVQLKEAGRWVRRARVRVSRPVPPGTIGMFDQAPARLCGSQFHSRACDDLAGVAAALATLDELRHRRPVSTIAALLTRAEEEGFIGAIAAARSPRLLRRSDRIISIEASAAQPATPLGAGPVIRVGDRTSVFNSSLSSFLTAQAEELSRKRRGFRFQRALMPGGTCESTVFAAYGFAATATCVAMRNYHNMDRRRKRIGPEIIDPGDWCDLVRLFVAALSAGHRYRASHRCFLRQLERGFAGRRSLLYKHRP